VTDETKPYDGPDPILLIAGTISAIIAAAVALDLESQLQWILASAAVLVGIVLLVISLRKRSD
jgi:membrane protein implicated in regulation of membrane protease activity